MQRKTKRVRNGNVIYALGPLARLPEPTHNANLTHIVHNRFRRRIARECCESQCNAVICVKNATHVADKCHVTMEAKQSEQMRCSRFALNQKWPP